MIKLKRFKIFIIYENCQKTQLNQRTRHNLQSHLACWHTKMCTVIRNTICESLVNILTLQTWMLVNVCRKIPKKRNKIKGPSITCSYIWDINISKYVYWLDTHSMKVWWRYVLPNTNAVHYWDIFSDIGQSFRTAQTKILENQKSGLVRII